MNSCVSFRGVAKAYGALRVLDDVSLECPVGQMTAIVGASGSGKTTMLQLVNGIVQPDAGEVRVFDEPVPTENVEQFRRGIGYAVQGSGLFPHMSSFENVTLLAKLEGWSQQDMVARFYQLLDTVELPHDVADRLPRELSGGQQQRLGICRALMLRPRLMLLDEPFSAVDPITRIELYEHFERVQEAEGVSGLLVTHDLREARRLATHLVILQQGVAQQHGPTLTVLANPAPGYVHTLVQSQLGE